MRRLVSVALLTITFAASAAASDLSECADSKSDNAIAACTRLIKAVKARAKNEDLSGVYGLRGRAFYSKGDYDNAIADFDDAIRLDPKLAMAYNFRGLIYWRKREYDLAIKEYDEAIRLNPKLAVAYGNRGEAYARKGEFDRAIGDYDVTLRLDPNSAPYNGRGFAYKQMGNFDRAILDLNEAIRIAPNNAAAYANRGDAYRQKGDLDRAFADLNEAVRLDPNLTPAYTNRGLAYEKNGDLDRARVDFSAALARPASNFITGKWALETARERLTAVGGAYARRGEGYEKIGELVRGLSDYRAALAISPDNNEYKEGVRRLEQKLDLAVRENLKWEAEER